MGKQLGYRIFFFQCNSNSISKWNVVTVWDVHHEIDTESVFVNRLGTHSLNNTVCSYSLPSCVIFEMMISCYLNVLNNVFHVFNKRLPWACTTKQDLRLAGWMANLQVMFEIITAPPTEQSVLLYSGITIHRRSSRLLGYFYVYDVEMLISFYNRHWLDH